MTALRHTARTASALLCALGAAGGCSPGETAAPELPRVELGDYAPAVRAQIEQAQARAAAQSTDAAASGELGMILHAYGLFEAAAACYERARHYAPAELRWAYYDGLVLAQRGRSAEAIAALMRATALQPGARDAQLELARQLRAAGRLEESRARLDVLESEHGRDSIVQMELGRTLFALGDAAAAVPHLERALEISGDRGDLHYALALAYQELGDDARAAAHRSAHERFATRPLIGITALPGEIARLDLGLQAAVSAERGRRLALGGDYEGALALADEQTRHAPWADYALALRSAHQGQPLAALPLLQRTRARAEEAGDSELVAAIDAELRRGLGAITP